MDNNGPNWTQKYTQHRPWTPADNIDSHGPAWAQTDYFGHVWTNSSVDVSVDVCGRVIGRVHGHLRGRVRGSFRTCPWTCMNTSMLSPIVSITPRTTSFFNRNIRRRACYSVGASTPIQNTLYWHVVFLRACDRLETTILKIQYRPY